MSSESLDDIGGAPSAAAPAEKPAGWTGGRGGARPGSGRKPKNGKPAAPRAASTPPPAEGDEAPDPDVQEVLAELGSTDKTAEVVGQAAYVSLMLANPQVQPAPEQVTPMVVTGKAMAKRYLGKAEAYLSLEGLFVLVWASILMTHWMRKPDENASNSGSGPVGERKDNVQPAAGLTIVVPTAPGS